VIRSLALLVVGWLATPFVFGYASLAVGGMSPLAARVFVTTWMWTVAYWGTLYHSNQVAKLFSKFGKRDG